MDIDIISIKDILVVLSPIIVALINYRSNKKTRKDIHLELEKSLKEKNADTNQILAKIDAELKSQKEMSSWNSSLPQTDEYLQNIDIKRRGNVSSLPDLVMKVGTFIEDGNVSAQELNRIYTMLQRIDLPSDDQELYPYEIPLLIQYYGLIQTIENKINNV